MKPSELVTQKDIDFYDKRFKEMDADGSGEIDVDEMRGSLKDIGI